MYKPMIRFFTILTMILLLTGVGMEGYSQVTYTTDGSGGWVRNPLTGGCTTITNHPSLSPIQGSEPTFDNRGIMTSPGCKISLVINHPVNYANLTIGPNVEIIVNEGGSLSISENLSIQGNTNLNSIISNGGEILIEGNLIANNGGTQTDTKLNIGLFNGGTFEINGLLDLGNDVELIIDGDERELNPLKVNLFNIGQRSNVEILDLGGLLVTGDVDYRGNNSEINVYGFFRTEGSVLITGGNGNQLNVFDDAVVVIEKNLDVRGTSDITFGGTSQTDIGGDILVSGNSKVTATETAQVFVCGSTPPICKEGDKNCQAYELVDGQFNPCRLLPVEYSSLEAQFLNQSRSAKISWSTTKEWESSHFEIERAVKGVEFVKIGEVNAAGWSDVLMQYTFEDTALPLGETNVLYRLKQVDLTGEYHYSKVLSVKTSGVQFTTGVWRAYPNPTLDNQLRISLLDRTQYDEEPITFRLVHPTAQSQAVVVKTEVEMNDQLSQMVARIPKGVFVVEIQWGQKIEHIKVLKQ